MPKTDYEKARGILSSYIEAQWKSLEQDYLFALDKAVQALDDCIEMGLNGGD